MTTLNEALDAAVADAGFSGVARVDRAGDVELDVAYAMADRAHEVPNTTGTRFATASATKGLTALTVMSLVGDGLLALDTPVRAVLGADLPLIADDVTVEHLLGHTSGIGDYLDEDEDMNFDDYVLPVPVQRLVTSEDYLSVLDGHPTKFAAGSAFAYCNSGYVVAAIIAERVGRAPFHELVGERVTRPVGMTSTDFLRSDELPGDAALGYVEIDGVVRSNVFHLPVRGSGDGGIFTTTADMAAFWSALDAGAIVAPDVVAAMTTAGSYEADAGSGMRYGLGFWIHPNDDDVVFLEGSDAGVSFRSVHDRSRGLTHTVISNTSTGAWPITRLLAQHLGTDWPRADT